LLGATAALGTDGDWMSVEGARAERVRVPVFNNGNVVLYRAGKPGADRAALEGAGISTFLHQGCDTLAILNAAYDEI